MRYVIGVLIVTGFLIWDGWRNDGRYLDAAVHEVQRLARMVGA